MLVLESIATETEVDFREGRRLHRSFSSLQSLFDLRAALDPYQHFISGKDCHALYDLTDGVFPHSDTAVKNKQQMEPLQTSTTTGYGSICHLTAPASVSGSKVQRKAVL